MSEVIEEILGKPNIAVLSGPSIAMEVAKKLPTSVVVASQNQEIAEKVRDLFKTKSLRVYTSLDIIGVQLGGALKNIIAISAGICDGLGFGTNAKSALVTRGLVEISRLGIKMGANPNTFSGLTGLGDLVTTCISPKSRNRWVGEQIGKGKKLNEILKEMEMIAEGIDTVKAGYKLAKLYNIEMPITEKVYQVLYENKDPLTAVSELMTREPKSEIIN
jgi:glycerol-3-phosphate dehydrogenase (NAD(P)+)